MLEQCEQLCERAAMADWRQLAHGDCGDNTPTAGSFQLFLASLVLHGG